MEDVFVYVYCLCTCNLISKLQNRVCTFHTEMSDPMNNYVHHGKKKPHQEVGDGYIFVKYSDA